MRNRPCSPEGSQGCGKCSPCRANWKRATSPRQPDKLPYPTLNVRLSVDTDRGQHGMYSPGPIWILDPCKPFAAEDHRPTDSLRRAWGWPPITEGYMRCGAFGPIRRREAA